VQRRQGSINDAGEIQTLAAHKPLLLLELQTSVSSCTRSKRARQNKAVAMAAGRAQLWVFAINCACAA
jgi:hypothetical protein